MAVYFKETTGGLAFLLTAMCLNTAAAGEAGAQVVSIPDGPPSAGISTIVKAPLIDMTTGPKHHANMGISAQAGPSSTQQLRAKMGESVTYDLYSGAVTIPANTAPHAAGGVSVYNGILDNYAAGVAGVGSSLLSICETSGCSVWGQNLVVKDVPDNQASGATRQALNGEEIDIRAYNADHKAIHGIDIQAHLFQPPKGTATGFSCAAVQYPWDNCFVSADNAAVTGLYLGAMQRVPTALGGKRPPNSPNEPSQFIKLGFTYQQTNPATGRPKEGAGTLQVVAEPGAAQGSMLQYSTFGDHPAHFMADGYYVHNTPGVSCKGPPTADFVVENGIVTHC